MEGEVWGSSCSRSILRSWVYTAIWRALLGVMESLANASSALAIMTGGLTRCSKGKTVKMEKKKARETGGGRDDGKLKRCRSAEDGRICDALMHQTAPVLMARAIDETDKQYREDGNQRRAGCLQWRLTMFEMASHRLMHKQ